MGSKRKPFDPTAPPDRWLNCPRKSEGFIAGTRGNSIFQLFFLT
jgi:hypothetical protein